MAGFNTKKAEFLTKIAAMKSPRVYSRRCSVYLCDGSNEAEAIEIYCASTMTEDGYISSANQSTKFRKWIA